MKTKLSKTEIGEKWIKLSDFARMTGTAPKSIQNWMAEGKIPNAEKASKFAKHRFSLLQGVSVAAINHLTDGGMKPVVAAKLAEIVRKRFREHMKNAHTKARLIAGEALSEEDTYHDLMVFTLANDPEGKGVAGFFSRADVADYFAPNYKTGKNPITLAFGPHAVPYKLDIIEADAVIFRCVEEYVKLRDERDAEDARK